MNRAVTILACLALAAALSPVAAPAASTSCPDSNPPNELVLAGGSDQTTQLGHAFATGLSVALANTNGCAVTGQLAGVGVEFSAPAGGASGSFGSGGTNTAIVGTDASGHATAPVFTANGTAGTCGVSASSDYGRVVFTVTNSANGVVASIAAYGGAGQSASVHGAYGQPLRARVLDAAGRAVQGASVDFVLGAGTYGAGASFLGGGTQASATTDASGVATSPPLVANGTPGPFTATAATDGVPAPAAYALSNTAAALTLSSRPSLLAATVGTGYAQPLRVAVVDAAGKPVAGASVVFAVAASHDGAGASFAGDAAQATVYADGDGTATAPQLVANDTAGAFAVTASVDGAAPLTFTLRNEAGRPAAVAAGAASSESAPLRARFPVRLAVTVTDADGNPVPGALVAFAAPRRGASGLFPHRRRLVRVRTDANGVAVAPAFRAGGEPGGYVVRASVRGVARAAAFALVNRPRG